MRASYFVLVNVVLPITNTVKAIEVHAQTGGLLYASMGRNWSLVKMNILWKTFFFFIFRSQSIRKF